MQLSIACSHHVHGLAPVHSHTNLAQTTIPLKRAFSVLTQTKSNSRITLTCNSQPQPLLNLCTPKPPTRIFSSNVRCGISSNMYGGNEVRSVREWLVLAGEFLSMAFPLWVSIGCVLGLMKPNCFNWVTPKVTIRGLNIIMLGMGMTLTLDDLRGALAMPKQVLYGFVLQYSVMPLSGFLISTLLNLAPHFAAGLILIGCSPGGTASNIITYLSRGNVALSVIMTTASTLTATIMTPFLTATLAGKYVAVDASGLLISTLQVVLFPVLAGAFLNQFFKPFVKLVSPLMPPIAVTTVAILCGNSIAQSSSAILVCGGQVILATFLLHASGFFFGYIFGRLLGLDVSSSRTISTQVGMKNSVLGIVLATKHFGDPLTAVPGAVSIVFQSIIGSILAGIWRDSMPVFN
ncbi:hypothetical protein AAZX31_12G224500 [Glycine max]|uniref:Uncharacterized protein n=1 Tax=Glycine max TaxID=3847 RepID=K7LWK4_SOYBN|nr:probable sodium/metabolite cotransporter BASS1, chloroplastic [Glycine max]KAH1144604.1 hypothetical protein GYH30_034710 [Glycine max]KRH27432.1 hypothetical protein GLYMA_12G234600v4 [Glycine max]|eukprot:XP_003539630.2 probable sodium/metabolite cotransporter BASS1, chloroplastic [Glycine max]